MVKFEKGLETARNSETIWKLEIQVWRFEAQKKFIPNNLDKFLNIYTKSVSIKNYVDIIGGLYIIVEI